MHGNTKMRRFFHSRNAPIELDEFRLSYRRARMVTSIVMLPVLFLLAKRIEHPEVAVPIIAGLGLASLTHSTFRKEARLLEMSIVDTTTYVLIALPLDVPEAVMMVVMAEAYIVFFFVPARTAVAVTVSYLALGLGVAAISVVNEFQVRTNDEVITITTLITILALGPTTWTMLRTGAEMYSRNEREAQLKSEREHLHAERAEVVVDLQEALESLSRAQTELLHAQKLEAIGSLAAGIAHEINTPIQYVGDNTRFAAESIDTLLVVAEAAQKLVAHLPEPDIDEVLGSGCRQATAKADIEFLTDELPAAMNESLDGLAQVARIVHALKSFAHPGTPDRSEADLNELITSTTTVSRNEWKYVADVNLDGLGADLQQVPVLAGPLKQIILNLIVNAAHAIEPVFEATGEKGRIDIRTFEDGEYATIEIEDSGTGIPEDIRDKIMDPFFTTKAMGKGTGQGLAIASSIIAKHDGRFTFTSEIGVGTTFRIELPLEIHSAAEKELDPAAV